MLSTSYAQAFSTITFAPLTRRLHPLLTIAVALALSLAAVPHASQAQLGPGAFNFCTFLEDSPQTSGARSAVVDSATGDDAWQAQTRIIQTFNGGNLSELLFEELEGGTWRDTARATPEYDSSDRLDRCTVEFKKGDTYVNAFRADLQYNNGNLDTQLNEVWDSTDANPDGAWVRASRSTFEYDANGNDTLQVDENWNRQSETWFNSQRFRRTYDAQDRIEEELQENWDLVNQTWMNSRRDQYTYTADSTVVVDQFWQNNMWNNDERQTTFLNNDDLPTETVTEDWNGTEWVNTERETFAYTTFDNTQKFERVITQTWDQANGMWVDDTRIRFSYTDVIPVELARFEAQRVNEGMVRLTWETASETNNSGFAVQRQTGAHTNGAWTNVHFVGGAGTTSEPQFYRFTDRGVPFEAETVRYRLKQVDLDGTAHLSNVVELDLGTPDQLTLHAPFPNPSRSEATIRYELPEASDVQIAVYDLLGRRVATPVNGPADAGHMEVQFRTQDLPSGTYLLHLRAAEQTRTQRLTVVK